jgi:hypothetical protein
VIDQLNDEAVAALPDDKPVTMLNLMRFRERSLDGNGSGGTPTCVTAGSPSS